MQYLQLCVQILQYFDILRGFRFDRPEMNETSNDKNNGTTITMRFSGPPARIHTVGI